MTASPLLCGYGARGRMFTPGPPGPFRHSYGERVTLTKRLDDPSAPYTLARFQRA